MRRKRGRPPKAETLERRNAAETVENDSPKQTHKGVDVHLLLVDRGAPPNDVTSNIQQLSEEGYEHYNTYDRDAGSVVMLFRRARD